MPTPQYTPIAEKTKDSSKTAGSTSTKPKKQRKKKGESVAAEDEYEVLDE